MCLHQVSKRLVISDLDSTIRLIEVQRLVLQTLGKEASDAEKWDRTRTRRMPRISINFQKGHGCIPWGWRKDLDEDCWAEGCFTIVKALFKKPWEAEGLTSSPPYRSESAQLHVPRPLLPELPAPPMSGLMGWLNRFQGECHPCCVCPAGSFCDDVHGKSFSIHLSPCAGEQQANRLIQTCVVTESQKSSTEYMQAAAGTHVFQASWIIFKFHKTMY